MLKWIKKEVFFAEELTNKEFVLLLAGALIMAPIFYYFVIAIHALFFILSGGE